MIHDIADRDALVVLAAGLKQRHFSAGWDGMDADTAAVWVSVNGDRLARDLTNGHYRPMPALGFYAAKKSGGHRSLAKLTAIDTIVQLRMLEVLSPHCETKL